MLTWIGIILIVVGGGAMLWALKNQKKNPNAQTFATLSLLVVIAGAVVLGSTAFFNPEEARAENNMMQYIKAKNWKLAEFTKEKFSGKKTIVVATKDMTQPNNISKSFLDAFMKEVPSTLVTLEAEPDAGIMEPANYATLSKALETHRDAEVVVLFCGLPYEPSEAVQILEFLPDAKFICWEDQSVTSLLYYVKSGKIAATAVIKPGLDFEKIVTESAPGKLSEAFDNYWLLLEPDTLEQTVKDNPKLVPQQQ